MRSTPVLLLALLSGAAFAGKKAPKTDSSASPPPATTTAPATEAAPAGHTDEESTPGPADLVKFRQVAMGATGKHMKASMMMAKGRVPATPESMQAQAEGLHALALDLGTMFPAGTDAAAVPDTEALDAIWSDPTGFQDKVELYKTETGTLVEAAQQGDLEAWKAQLGQVGHSCGACHDTYRQGD